MWIWTTMELTTGWKLKRKWRKEKVAVCCGGGDVGILWHLFLCSFRRLLPTTHAVPNTSSFLGEERDSLKFMNRYGKGGSNKDVPGPNHYIPDYQGRSPSMYKTSFNGLAYVPEPLTYLGQSIGGTTRSSSSQDRDVNGTYDPLGRSYDRAKLQSTRQRKQHKDHPLNKDSPSLLPDLSSPSPPTATATATPTATSKRLSFHERQRRPRTKSRHGLEDQNWFKHGGAPTLKEDKAGHRLKGHQHSGKNVKKALNEKKRLQIDTIKLGNVFFKTSPTKLKPNEQDWQKRLVWILICVMFQNSDMEKCTERCTRLLCFCNGMHALSSRALLFIDVCTHMTCNELNEGILKQTFSKFKFQTLLWNLTLQSIRDRFLINPPTHNNVQNKIDYRFYDSTILIFFYIL